MQGGQPGGVKEHSLSACGHLAELLDCPDGPEWSRPRADCDGRAGEFVGSLGKAHDSLSCKNRAVLPKVSVHVGNPALQDASLAQGIDALIWQRRVGEQSPVDVLDGHGSPDDRCNGVRQCEEFASGVRGGCGLDALRAEDGKDECIEVLPWNLVRCQEHRQPSGGCGGDKCACVESSTLHDDGRVGELRCLLDEGHRCRFVSTQAGHEQDGIRFVGQGIERIMENGAAHALIETPRCSEHAKDRRCHGLGQVAHGSCFGCLLEC